MAQQQINDILGRFAVMASRWGSASPLDTMRADLENFFLHYEPIPDTAVQAIDLGVPCLLVAAPQAQVERVVLMFHGGGFSTGSARAHMPFASHLSQAAASVAISVDYRLAPEHVFPAALEDCLAAYRALIASGVSARRVALCGDSAGGGLALAAAIRLRDAGEALPACLVLLSPWSDLACDGESYHGNAGRDPIGTRDMALGMARTYLAGASPYTAGASALGADLYGLPPLLLHVADTEVFLDDAKTIARRASEAGGAALLKIYPGLIHQWHLHVGALDEAADAIAEIGGFIRQHLED